MSDDILRLRQWMSNQNMDIRQLASMMDIPFISAYTVIKRRGTTTDKFVNTFIRRFGHDVAKEIFVTHLAPVNVAEPA